MVKELKSHVYIYIYICFCVVKVTTIIFATASGKVHIHLTGILLLQHVFDKVFLSLPIIFLKEKTS
jgi:hypothetical protein